MKQYNTGFVLGKFCPLHRGHLMLIDKAIDSCQKVYIVVDNIMDEVFPVAQRMKWVKEQYPDALVLTQPHPLPQDPSETPDFWTIWHDTLLSMLPEKIDAVFASEAYGARLAQELNAEFVMVDQARTQIPISATQIRENRFANWEYLSPAAQRGLMKTICIYGPESTGKSTLTQQLAEHFKVPFIEEYAKQVIEEKNGDICFEDMETIVLGHHQRVMEALEHPQPLLFIDTDAIASKIWSNDLFGKESPVIEETIAKQHFDYYLLLDVDLPWVDDIHRYRPNERKDFFKRCKEQLDNRHKRYSIIRGTGSQRFDNALKCVESLLNLQ